MAYWFFATFLVERFNQANTAQNYSNVEVVKAQTFLCFLKHPSRMADTSLKSWVDTAVVAGSQGRFISVLIWDWARRWFSVTMAFAHFCCWVKEMHMANLAENVLASSIVLLPFGNYCPWFILYLESLQKGWFYLSFWRTFIQVRRLRPTTECMA